MTSLKFVINSVARYSDVIALSRVNKCYGIHTYKCIRGGSDICFMFGNCQVRILVNRIFVFGRLLGTNVSLSAKHTFTKNQSNFILNQFDLIFFIYIVTLSKKLSTYYIDLPGADRQIHFSRRVQKLILILFLYHQDKARRFLPNYSAECSVWYNSTKTFSRL